MGDRAGENFSRWNERTGLNLDGMNSCPHDILTDFFGQCIAGDSDDVRVFVPLCGKSVADMKWLYDEGYRVYGVDVSEKALQMFFKEYDMKYLHTPAIAPDGFDVYKSPDDRIKLFCGDLSRFSTSVAGCAFDVIWDRSAFMTINEPDRERYVNVITQLLLPTGRILLATYVYDDSKWKGPPYSVSRKDVHGYFGGNFHVNTLRTYDSLQSWHQDRWGVNWLQETGYMLSLKT